MANAVPMTPPSSPNIGDRWRDPRTGFVFSFVARPTPPGGGVWVQEPPVGMTARQPPQTVAQVFPTPFDVTAIPRVTTSPSPPTTAVPCDLWFDTITGFFFVYYDDGTTQQWVVTNPGRGGQIGPPGPQGIPGIDWKGDWDNATAYGEHDGVQFNGSSYFALVDNINDDPVANPDKWDLLAAKGDQGPQGDPVTIAEGSGIDITGTTANPTIAVDATIARLASPIFTGTPAAPTPTLTDSSTYLATTAFVKSQDYATVNYVDGIGALKAPVASPVFTGDPRAPTPVTADNDTSIATTAFVRAAITSFSPPPDLTPYQLKSEKGVASGYAGLDGSGKVPAAQLPAYVDDVLEFANLAAFPATGTVGIIYVALDTNRVYRWSGSAYVEISPSPGSTDAVPEGSVNLYFTNARAQAANAAAIALKADLASPTFTGDPKAPTPATADNDTSIATTAFVKAQAYATTAYVDAADALKAPLASPAFTGNPTAPTPTAGDNDTSIATTAFVAAAVASATSISVGIAPPGSPAANALWWNSETGVLFIYYNDGNTTQWVPAAPPGSQAQGLRLISRQVITSAQPTLDFTNIPVDINDIEVRFDLLPVSNDVACIMQMFDAGGAIINSGYPWSNYANTNTATLNAGLASSSSSSAAYTAGIVLNYHAGGNSIGNGAGQGGLQGRVTINNIRDTARPKHAVYQSSHLMPGGSYTLSTSGEGTRNAAGAISGVRFLFGIGSIANGVASLWGSP